MEEPQVDFDSLFVIKKPEQNIDVSGYVTDTNIQRLLLENIDVKLTSLRALNTNIGYAHIYQTILS